MCSGTTTAYSARSLSGSAAMRTTPKISVVPGMPCSVRMSAISRL
jgi:hypothetical protein